MKRPVFIAGLLSLMALWWSACAPAADDLRLGPTSSVSGTGVSIRLPADLKKGPLGTFFTDSYGETIVMVIAGPKDKDPENNPVYKSLYPASPKELYNPAYVARLYRRTRAENGGKWDGWSFHVVGKRSALTVTVMYTGDDPAWFDGLEAIFGSIQWDESKMDSERAFGAHISVPGLKLVEGPIGGLSFSEGGRWGTPVPSLIVEVMPKPKEMATDVVPAICEPGLKNVFKEYPYTGPNMFNEHGIVGCDGWGSGEKARVNYVFMLRTPEGAVLSGIGSDVPENFPAAAVKYRKALLSLRVITGTK